MEKMILFAYCNFFLQYLSTCLSQRVLGGGPVFLGFTAIKPEMAWHTAAKGLKSYCVKESVIRQHGGGEHFVLFYRDQEGLD